MIFGHLKIFCHDQENVIWAPFSSTRFLFIGGTGLPFTDTVRFCDWDCGTSLAYGSVNLQTESCTENGFVWLSQATWSQNEPGFEISDISSIYTIIFSPVHGLVWSVDLREVNLP